MTSPSFAVVTPVYEDEKASRILFKELSKEFPGQFFLVAVDDGSVKQPVDVEWLRAAGCRGTVLRLNRNVGHQRAIAIGISYAARHYPDLPVVTMDSDGEDKPESIKLLFSEFSDEADIVTATRRSRVETVKFKTMYFFYRILFQLLCGRKLQFGNFALYSPAAIKRLSLMPELWIHIAATVLCSKLRVKYQPIDRGPRYAGKSKMNFTGLALHGFRGLMVFAEDVLVRVGIVCAFFASISAFLIATATILKFAGHATPGWFSLTVGVLLLMLFQTGTITLMTLMMTGILKAVMSEPPNFEKFVSGTFPGDADL